jgi:sigma-B regulation protein RsbU (phosphoserine phosphatase)
MAETAEGRPGILFVDDESNILSALQRELRDWSLARSVRILTANSPSMALGMLGEEPGIGVVVSDLRMPEMLGSDLLMAIHERWPSVITILLTGFTETAEVMKAIKAGIFSYILKPWDPDYLKVELDKAIEIGETRRKNAEYEKRIEEELRLAGALQRMILKPVLKSSVGIEFRVSYRPSPLFFCGGDYYDIINLSADRFLVLAGEIADHGVKAAFITSILKAIIFEEYVKNAREIAFSPGALLEWLDTRMAKELRAVSDPRISLLAAVIDRRALTLTYANAGHCRPFLISGWIPRELSAENPVLCAGKAKSYPESTEKLQKMDTFLAFTDGISNPDGKARIAMADIIKETPYGSDFHRRLLEKALEKSGSADFTDDVTIVTAHVE